MNGQKKMDLHTLHVGVLHRITNYSGISSQIRLFPGYMEAICGTKQLN